MTYNFQEIFFNKNKNNKNNKNNKYIFIISFIILLSIINWIYERSHSQKNKILMLLKSKDIKINLIVIFIFIIYTFIFYKPNSYMAIATKTGIYASLIALCAYLDIPLLPFWITHLIVYSTHDTIG
tara:strand:+ start:3703 stop:4080 length:378 start_codon:yes stop_codon:yes gene_type:complete